MILSSIDLFDTRLCNILNIPKHLFRSLGPSSSCSSNSMSKRNCELDYNEIIEKNCSTKKGKIYNSINIKCRCDCGNERNFFTAGLRYLVAPVCGSCRPTAGVIKEKISVDKINMK